MEQETVNQLIEKYTKNINLATIRNGRKVIIILVVLAACFLVSMKSFISTAVLLILTVCEVVYFSVVIRKKTVKLYNGIAANIIILLNVVLSFNIWMYYIQSYLGYSDVLITVILLIVEIVCLFMGFFHTCRCVRNGTVHEARTMAAPAASVLSSVLGLVSVRMISKTDVSTQFTIYTLLFTFVNSLVLFSLGMTYGAMAYFIRKHHIPDRELNNDVTSPLMR